MERQIKYRDKIYKINSSLINGEIVANVENRQINLAFQHISEFEYLLNSNGKQMHVFAAKDKNGNTFLSYKGKSYHLTEVLEDFSVADSNVKADGKLKVLMPGKIIKIMVNINDAVIKNQPVFIVESMKMENTQQAPFAGKVIAINAQPGQQVDAGTVIVQIEPLEENNDENK